jgi:photosystem II stability/assembly factor-like uncharacterized protein
MKADTTRTTFRRERHFSSVRLQQGRVTLDADFNEQADISGHRDVTLARDVIGGSGAPDDGFAGFQVQAAVRLAALAVSGASRWAAGQRGTIVAGASWTPQAANTTADLHAIAARSASLVIGVGDGGTVVRTTNGGTAWSASTIAGAPALRGITLTGATDAWAVGDGGKVYASTNDGQGWAPQVVTGVSETLRGVDAPSTNRPVAVGDGGRVIAFDGANWVIRTSGVSVALNAVAFADGTTTGWAVGAGGTILKTTDGGATWTPQVAPAVSASLRAVEAENANTVWAAGDDGTLLRTTNGGGAWSVIAPPTSQRRVDLTAVRAAGGGSVVVAGDPWGLATVTAGGAWTPAALPSEARDLFVSPGRMWVEGVLVETEDPVRLLSQPDSPGETMPGAGTYIAYLDVWDRHVTAVERPELREIALGGPDTASRTRTTWRLRLEPAGGIAACEQLPPDWAPANSASTGRLRARANPQQAATNECLVPAGGGYRRLENQHYRIEVHAPGAAGAATYKWSRDNGSVLGRLEGTTPPTKRIQVSVGGRSVADAFGDAKWVELSDERQSLLGLPGTLLEVQSVDGDEIVLVNAPPAFSTFTGTATVRRWEDNAKTVPAGPGWQALADDGIEVAFSGGDYRTADYWSFPARTLQPQVEWTRDAAGVAQFEPRHGTEHRFCPLALVTVTAGGTFTNISDCRPLFTPLTDLLQAFIAGGEGQEAEAPVAGPVTLNHKLEVGVTNGRRPVKNAKVQFTVSGGAGTVNAGSGAAATVPALTDANGIASVSWSIQDVEFHQVTAELRDRTDARVGPPLHFNARLEPRPPSGACTVAVAPGDDLQGAIDSLPADGGELCLSAGRYELELPLLVKDRRCVTITGRGPSTVLASKFDVALFVLDSEDVTIRTARFEGGREPFEEVKRTPRGAITVIRSQHVTIHDCEATCPDWRGELPTQACIAVFPHEDPEEPDVEILPRQRLVIERNGLGVGHLQVGIHVDSPWIAQITGNHLVLGPADEEMREERLASSAQLIVGSMLAAIRGQATADTREAVFKDNKTRVNVDEESLTLPLWLEFAERATAVEMQNGLQALQNFVAKIPADDELRKAALPLIDALRTFTDGIVVTGNPEVVDVSRNVVEGATRGIDAGGIEIVEREHVFAASRVTLDDNVVNAEVLPGDESSHWGLRVRHAWSINVTNTKVGIEFVAYGPEEDDLFGDVPGRVQQYDPGDAVLVEGLVGNYAVVRHTHANRYKTGVRFQPSNDPGQAGLNTRMWLVAETVVDPGDDVFVGSMAVRQENNVQL